MTGRAPGGAPRPAWPEHLLQPKAAVQAPAILRFVGADALGRDVHVTLEESGGQQKGPAGPGSTWMERRDQLAAIIRPGPRCEAPDAE